ncbi:MAG: MFS transporter [Anaerolineae bacterium]
MSTNAATPPDAGVRAVLALRGFRTLWIGQAISQVGDGLTNLAILIVVNQLTGSTAALAGVTIALALPQLVFGLFAGVFVDRWDRRRTMIVSDVLRGLIVLGLIAVRAPSEVWLLYVLAFAQASVGAFFNPAKSALIPRLVQRDALLAANSLSQTTQVVTGVIGTVLAGILIAALGGAWIAFSLDALSFFLSALFIYTIRVEPQAEAAGARRRGSILGELGEGLHTIASDRIMLGALVTFAVTMLGMGAVNVLFVPFLLNDLRADTAMLGVVEAAQVVGMVVGSGLVAMIAARLRVNWLIAGGVMGIGLMIAGAGFVGNMPTILVLLFVVGLFLTPVHAANATLMQQRVPDEKRGRVGSAMNTVIVLASVISMAASGVLGDRLGIRKVFWGAGAVLLLAGLLAAFLMQERQTQPATVSSGAEGATAE